MEGPEKRPGRIPACCRTRLGGILPPPAAPAFAEHRAGLYIIRYLSGFLSSASAGEGLFSRLFAEEGRDKKKLPEKMKKSLHSMDAYGIIIERDCTRYAKKWKVATL